MKLMEKNNPDTMNVAFILFIRYFKIYNIKITIIYFTKTFLLNNVFNK